MLMFWRVRSFEDGVPGCILFPKLEVKHASRNSGGARRSCLSSRWNTAVEMFASERSSGSWLPSSVELNGSQELGAPAALRCHDLWTCSPLVPECRLWDPVRMFLTPVVLHWPFYNLVWQFWCFYLKRICCLRWDFYGLFFSPSLPLLSCLPCIRILYFFFFFLIRTPCLCED